jgi:hypothetical protein
MTCEPCLKAGLRCYWIVNRISKACDRCQRTKRSCILLKTAIKFENSSAMQGMASDVSNLRAELAELKSKMLGRCLSEGEFHDKNRDRHN